MGEINPVYTPPHKGGGMFGTIAGSIAGGVLASIAAAAAPYSGGTSLALIPAAAAAGGAIGNAVGSNVDPAKAETVSEDVPKSDLSRNNTLGSLNNMPEVQMATMQDAKRALSTSNLPNAEDYMSQIDQAHQLLRQRLGTNSSLG